MNVTESYRRSNSNRIPMFVMICLLLQAVSVNLFFAQSNYQWIARYNGTFNHSDLATNMVLDSFGNSYITGRSISQNINFDYATVKYNSAGIEQWSRRYNGPENSIDEAYAVAVDLWGNVFVTGLSCSYDSIPDFLTIKYNSEGTEQWITRYNGTGNSFDEGHSLATDKAGNLYVAGLSRGIATGFDITTIKYNTNGQITWVRRYNGPVSGNDYSYENCLRIDTDGNIYVAGSSTGAGYNLDYVVIKYDSNGAEQWVQRYDGTANRDDEVWYMALDDSANVYITGPSEGAVTFKDYATVKYDKKGTFKWASRYHGPSSTSTDRAFALAVDRNGNVYVTGSSHTPQTFFDYATVKYDSEGNQKWVKRYNGTAHNETDYARAIALDGLGNLYVTGSSSGLLTYNDYVTIKYDTSGNMLWLDRYTGELSYGNDVANSIAIDMNGNVIVSGYSDGINYSDYTTIKYSLTIGIQPVSTELPGKYHLSQNFPNPFNSETTVDFKLPAAKYTTIKIYDVLGRLIETLADQLVSAGSYSVKWNAANLPSGVYYYRITAGEFTDVKKMILVK